MAAARGERRADGRTRTRLRPGKILCPEGTFLADCLILDRSVRGARIRMLGAESVPETFRLVDEAGRESFLSRTAWHRGGEAGLTLASGGEAMGVRDFLAVAGPYYAVR